MSEKMSHESPLDESEILSVVIENNANTIPEGDEKWLKSLMEVEKESKYEDEEKRLPKIQKVCRMLREKKEYNKCFDPLVVSIGPHHHGKPELDLIEKHKLLMATQYIKACEQTPMILYKKVMEVAGDARKCYEERLTEMFSDSEFCQMMFLDGCFILQFIHTFVDSPNKLKMGILNAAFVKRDLLLLENQLPFQVLEVLIRFRFKEEWKKLFIDFFRPHPYLKNEILIKEKPIHILDFVHSILIDKNEVIRSFPGQNDWYSYRSAKELKSVGINFRRSKSHRFTDVSFYPFSLLGFLRLPPITIDDCTMSMLLNLVAYEACPSAPNDLGVSSYICLMDSLIDHAEDVKELRKKGIIFNLLGSDEQVADIFNSIAEELVPNPYAYADVKEKIEMHYKNKMKIWVAEWIHTHFTSPWTLLASFAAVFAIFLSAVQTYWTIYK